MLWKQSKQLFLVHQGGLNYRVTTWNAAALLLQSLARNTIVDENNDLDSFGVEFLKKIWTWLQNLQLVAFYVNYVFDLNDHKC
jgi:hypothetical protein